MVELEERQLECRKNCAFNFPVSSFFLLKHSENDILYFLSNILFSQFQELKFISCIYMGESFQDYS